MSHTPGPWYVSITTTGIDVRDRNRTRIAAVTGHTSFKEDEYEANARLFAAAPDLLAACRLMKKLACDILMNDYQDSDSGIAAQAVLDAIAKAEGSNSGGQP